MLSAAVLIQKIFFFNLSKSVIPNIFGLQRTLNLSRYSAGCQIPFLEFDLFMWEFILYGKMIKYNNNNNSFTDRFKYHCNVS
jgi:hypothetical protein